MSATQEAQTELPRPIGTGMRAVVGQDIVLRALRRAIERDRLPHALLFAGPQGVGKATTALLLAQALNCQVAGPVDTCGDCVSCNKIGRGSAARYHRRAPQWDSSATRHTREERRSS